MRFQDRAGLRCLQFESLPNDEIAHGIFTRRGGVSEGPWSSLNVGLTVGDRQERVLENRRLLLNSLNRPAGSTYDVWQVHSAEIMRAKEPRNGPPYPKADGVVTDNPRVTLLLRFADCLPILLFDPEQRAIGLVHAGWKGTVRGAAKSALEAMTQAFDSRPERMVAALGPCIQRHHYPVGPEVVAALRNSFGRAADDHLETVNGQTCLDLVSANACSLRAEGLEAIETSDLCTACHPQDWYSHRGEGGCTGRFGAVIGLKGQDD